MMVMKTLLLTGLALAAVPAAAADVATGALPPAAAAPPAPAAAGETAAAYSAPAPRYGLAAAAARPAEPAPSQDRASVGPSPLLDPAVGEAERAWNRPPRRFNSLTFRF